ncbi:transcriptional regulator family: Fungal Specific TF [Penicillium riverlandense]|uniref:transcriptional regulator family: Fungal Specific TF n=1 Tax=Penicillium riverlandense TaxID=1903569 RepID=UPI002546B230|nr:transcriptional regulator family: Fungal Specific TF [Penicillium riverlandense]KAJ5807979.1 transcriptional regulator family: Fungal Specific TF [Penicillium riverlandense]
MDSGRNSGEEGSSKKGCAFCHTGRHPSPHGSTPTSENAHPKEEARTPPGMARIGSKFVLSLTDNLTGGDDMFAHRDFLASATAAVSQSKRPEFTEDATSFYPTDEPYYGDEDVLIERILEDFPSRAGAEALISAFFFYAEANWYYFDEPSFRDQLFGLYDSGLSPTLTSPKFICLALAVFAMGSQFVHLYQADPLDNSETMTETMTVAQTGIPGTRYFQHAQKLVPHIVASPSLEGLLSCLLLALYVLPIHNTNTCYTYLGISLRIAICLGLHRKSASSDLSPTLSEVRNRIFWTTYTIERTLDKSSREDIRSQLLSWKAALPPQLTTLNDTSLRLNVHLQLHYSMVWIYIGRAALIDRVRNFLSKKESSKSDYGTREERHKSSESCVEHAAQIIDLIDLLRTRGQLGRFSHTDFHTCSSAAVVVLLESILHPRLTSYSKVRTAMDALRYMATGSDFAKNSLKYVNDFQVVVNKALASMYRRDHGTSCSMRESNSLGCGESPASRDTFMQSSVQPFDPPDSTSVESHPGADTEDLDPSYHQFDEEAPSMALFDDIETALESCSFTELHLLGLDSLYSSQVLNWDNVGA